MQTEMTPFLTRMRRLFGLLCHVVLGFRMIAFQYPKKNRAEQARLMQTWSLKLLKILNIDLVQSGHMPETLIPNNTLVVGNHISWLDIMLINSTSVCSFVGMQEIRRWPVVGWLVANAGTIFIDRKNRRDSLRVNSALSQELASGKSIAFFPEAQTTLGVSLYPFKAALFEPILMSQGQILPFYIKYTHAGQYTAKPSFSGDVSFFGSLFNILSVPNLQAEIAYIPPFPALPSQFENRFELANFTQKLVAEASGLPILPPEQAPKRESRVG
ncbi:MAG: 1-acyl-sn-glycerol-3-phosphate acyltransferase [Neisseriaceae bacterium]|nr:1-acyl-sn-glycerol-3-phosphate acyltransferase [Neisseriaceae bacterium]